MRNFNLAALIVTVLSLQSLGTRAQTIEWRLGNFNYSNVDPDGAGPATGSATFTLQMHTASGTISNILGISTGWAWQSANAMLPTGSPCGTNSTAQPGNITMSTALSSLGFTYNNVNECSGTVSFTTGGQTFDRRAVGTIDGGTFNLTTTWIDVFTVTLWSLNSTFPQAGYVVINSGAGGAPGEFSTYSVADDQAGEYAANSLTYSTPLTLGSSLPVVFSSFDVSCRSSQALISWSTETETNSSHFVIQKSIDGSSWSDLRSITAAGNSSMRKYYQVTVNQNGNAMYRVKQVDMNGSTGYTSVRSTDCGSNTAITAYPVPAKDVLHISVNATTGQQVMLQMTDATGRKVRALAGRLAAGMNYFDMNVSGLPAGYYLLQVIRDQQETETISVIKQ